MKKLLFVKSSSLVFLMVCTFMLSFGSYASAEPQEEEYAKWSKVAIEKVKEKYPRAEVKDFLYAGRVQISQTEAADRFLFFINNYNDGTEVRVIVTFNKKTDKLINVEIKELE